MSAVVYLHYFDGELDWYITEIDQAGGRLFGFVDGDSAAVGGRFDFFEIDTLISNNNCRLDHHGK